MYKAGDLGDKNPQGKQKLKKAEWFMDKKYICYCGLYCENCAVMAKVTPAAKTLYTEMVNGGFEGIMHLIPGSEGFWPFLKSMATEGICVSCKDGSGDPACAVRICAKEKGVEVCALCDSYPCEKLAPLCKGVPVLEHDNALLREKGMEAWAELQDERRDKGFTYAGEK